MHQANGKLSMCMDTELRIANKTCKFTFPALTNYLILDATIPKEKLFT